MAQLQLPHGASVEEVQRLADRWGMTLALKQHPAWIPLAINRGLGLPDTATATEQSQAAHSYPIGSSHYLAAAYQYAYDQIAVRYAPPIEGCIFCDIIDRTAPAKFVAEWPDALAIVPRNPVVEGHVLVLPKLHVTDFIDDPDVTASVVRAAAQLAGRPANLITSAGSEATQTVFHLHLHIVPRAADDGLHLPWTGQIKEHA